MVLCIELGEEVEVGLPRHTQPERGRSSRAGEPERLHLEHCDPELLLKCPPDRISPLPADIQVSAAAPPVGHREDLIGSQQPKRHYGYSCTERGRHDHIKGVINAQIETRQDQCHH